ncbi:PREDICTED: gametogenetin-binding protein 2-like [Dinoponera quadriceps]|uniref:Gametogenetin-binding protein 2-like n=1 Tax=Dinoponera quadriceps TaxID=609295 RepID=A0A6P3YCV3_DINQU|nr:PREDICTED: gametogenetin-binding protein 2-like [Dinoponera quadriceps]
MARLVNVCREDKLTNLSNQQMLLCIDENLTMVMDITHLGAICDNPIIRGKPLEEFVKKMEILTKEEVKASFEVSCKDIVAILSETVPCVGCRRSVERLLHALMKTGQPAFHQLVITSNGLLSIKDEVLKSPEILCTMLHGHSTRLNDLVEQQPRNRKSQRCMLHSLEIQRMRPPPNAWREVWECLDQPCREELTLIETDVLDETLDTYLRKHRFCGECRNKVLLASSLLTKEPDPTKEKGYAPILYTGIKRCIADRHIHLPTITNYIGTIIGRAQPELMGRERHAKTLEIAQEEVLTCLGICMAERLHKVHRRLREEETVCKVLAAAAIDALSRKFETAVEMKRGYTQLELLYEEFTREEMAKQQKREKMRLKRRKQKERRYEAEAEEKENACDCSSERQNGDSQSSCVCAESKPTTQNIDRHKLQVLDPKNKGLRRCKCPDCLKKMKTPAQSQNKTEQAFPLKKTTSPRKTTVKSSTETKAKSNTNQSEQSSPSHEQFPREHSSDISESCMNLDEKLNEVQWNYEDDCKDPMTKKLIDAWIAKPRTKSKYMWIEMRKRFKLSMSEGEGRSSSEQSSQDCGYSSEHNISSSSLPSTPDGSEIACNDACCKHSGDSNDLRSCDKLIHSISSISLLKKMGSGLTLTQMLEDSLSDDEDDEESHIPAEEVLEFKSRMCQVTEKRRELRRTLRERFAVLCSHMKPFIINQ